jgi:hypothetical protein
VRGHKYMTAPAPKEPMQGVRGAGICNALAPLALVRAQAALACRPFCCRPRCCPGPAAAGPIGCFALRVCAACLSLFPLLRADLPSLEFRFASKNGTRAHANGANGPGARGKSERKGKGEERKMIEEEHFDS